MIRKASHFIAILVGFLCLSCEVSFAHGTERGLVMLLPTEYYRIGGSLAVAASFFLLLFFPAHWIRGGKKKSFSLASFPRIKHYWTSSLSFVFLAFLILAGFIGDTDPYANPLPLFIWTIWWVGFTILQFITGNLWPYLNPWTGPAYLFNKICGTQTPMLSLPKWAGYWPATLLFAGFAWYELISLSPDDPLKLTLLVIVYWLIGFIGVILFGEKPWFEKAEPFSIFFRLIGALSPLQYLTNVDNNHVKVSLVWPGSGLKDLKPLPISGVLFVLLTLSSVSFDGFLKTFTWASWININPLEFPGRSAVTGINTIGFMGAFIVLSMVFLTSVYVGCLFTKQTEIFKKALGKLIYAIIPISLAFHLAHYMTVLLVNSQYAALAFNDPFSLNWNLLGLNGYMVTTSFLTNLDGVEILWQIQTLVIVLGHMISIYLAHVIAGEIFGFKNATISQAALALLMIFYTLFGLWLLSTPAMG